MGEGTFGGPPPKPLSREDILKIAAGGRRIEKVAVPEWGGFVHVREMSALERDRFEQTLGIQRRNGKSAGRTGATARLVGMCVCDAEGRRLFATEGDVAVLGKMPVMGMQRCLRAIIRINGFEPGDVEELEADFDDGPDSG